MRWAPRQITIRLMSVECVASDVFLSHSSRNKRLAAGLCKRLEEAGLSMWYDADDVRFGGLLLDSIQAAIDDSGAFVLLWSASAARSRWVMAEFVTAVHLGRPIVPIRLDTKELPLALEHVAYLDTSRDRARLPELVARAVRQRTPTVLSPVIAGDLPTDVSELVDLVANAQYRVLDLVVHDRDQARSLNDEVSTALSTLHELVPSRSIVRTLAGYQAKNAYLVEHWEAVQAGQGPSSSPLLSESEWHFYDALAIDPFDVNALNGLGTVLFLQRELAAAAFFQGRAVELAAREGNDYGAAVADLAQTTSFQGKQNRTPSNG